MFLKISSPKQVFANVLQKLHKTGVKNPHNNKPAKAHELRKFRKIGKDRLTRRYQLSEYESHDLHLTEHLNPKRVRLSLKQSLGAPSEPLVRVGEEVEKGALISRIPDGKLGSNLHASISGKITNIDNSFITIEV